MGSGYSSSGQSSVSAGAETKNQDIKGSRVLFFLHRTWAIIVTEKWYSRTKFTRRTRQRGASSSASEFGESSRYSQYSFCSCSQCQRDDGFSSGCASDLFGSGSSMAPNSEESLRIGPYSIPGAEDTANNKQEKQRPPIYNPEDYALCLKKWGRKTPNGSGGVTLYPTPTSSETDLSRPPFIRDYRNPMLLASGSEMTLRQFGTVSELLAKLKSDLRLAYPSFTQEFVSEPLDGVTLLLDLLRAIQLSQSNNHQQPNNTVVGKIPPALQRRALLDELSCLQCLLLCCQRFTESLRRLTASSAGLFTLAVCIMSNVTKSRILALQLLTKTCQPPILGHTSVSEALSTLRLRFGEPVRFRFLVGMLMSAGGQGELMVAGLRFLNNFLDTAGSSQKRLYVQAELEQAGFDLATVKKNISINSASTEQIFEELDHWEKHHLDVETLMLRLENSDRENETLRDKVLLMERRVQILLEEKGILISLEQCLKERCSELQEEVESLKSPKHSINNSSKHEDEGISSSERSLTPEIQQESVYDIYSPQENMQKKTLEMKNAEDDEDEETTIDEVIEELKNIINDAETEQYKKEQEEEKAKLVVATKIHINVDSFSLDDELEIVPSDLHPQPPRKSKSLVHLFLPAEDYDYGHKELFFENETASSSSSDSLFSATKYQLPRVENEKRPIKRSESFRHQAGKGKLPLNKNPSFDGGYFSNSHIVSTSEDCKKTKSKSLDRIDDGLDSMVDIIVTDHKFETTKNFFQVRTSDLTSQEITRKFSAEGQKKMFLPSKRDHSDIPYYFPRIQEKRSNSFLIRRGHANAGLYSGQSLLANKVTNNLQESLFLHQKSSGSSKCRKNAGKVTDLPSGLY